MSLQASIPSVLFNKASQYGFQATNLWNFFFLDSFSNTIGNNGDAATNVDLVAGTGRTARKDSSILAGLVQSINIDFPKIETEQTPFNFTHPESYKGISDVNMTFLETSKFTVYTYFKDWFDQIYDIDNHCFKTGIGSQYRSGLMFYQAYPLPLIAPNTVGLNLVNDLISSIPDTTAVLLYEGLYFKGFNAIEANYSSAEPLKIQVSFACDKVTLTPLGSLGLTMIPDALNLF